jgi:hypothetical protein
VPTPSVAKTNLHNAVGNGKAAIWSEGIIASRYSYKSLAQKGHIALCLKLTAEDQKGSNAL